MPFVMHREHEGSALSHFVFAFAHVTQAIALLDERRWYGFGGEVSPHGVFCCALDLDDSEAMV